MTTPLVSIITVDYKQRDVTCALLDSLRKNSYANLEVILVDNAQEEDYADFIRKHYPEVKFIASGSNLGFAGGNNLGVRASRGAYLFFINNDTLVPDGTIETLLALFQKRPKLGIVSPMLCYYEESLDAGVDLIQYVGTTPVHPLTARNKTLGEMEKNEGQYQTAQPTAYAHGAAMMLPRKVVEEVGMMAEDFFLYYEELDWCEQIRAKGYEIYVEPRAKIYHKESVSVGKMSTLKTYYLNRNRIYFFKRHKSGLEKVAFMLFLFFATIPKNSLMYLLKGEFDHLKAFWKAVWWNLSGNGNPVTKNVLPELAKATQKPVV